MASGRPQAWGVVLRSALLFTPFLAVTLAGLAYLVAGMARDGATAGGIVAIVLVGFVALLFGYQVVQSVRDLFGGVVETSGVVERRWSHSDFFIFRNSYVFVERNVFRLEPEQYIDVELGDTVRVVHFPHTSTVESIEVVARRGAGRSDNG